MAAVKLIAKEEDVDAVLIAIVGKHDKARCEVLGRDGADLRRLLPLIVAALQEPEGGVQ